MELAEAYQIQISFIQTTKKSEKEGGCTKHDHRKYTCLFKKRERNQIFAVLKTEFIVLGKLWEHLLVLTFFNMMQDKSFFFF